MMKAFLTMVFGGPSNYTGKSMREAHSKIKVSDELFDLTIGHLADTLTELCVGQDLI
jgi:truncated hemoglobin YjbI